MKNNKGFTLVEMMVVVVIIGILVAIALPQYRRTIERSKAAQALTLLKAIEQAYKFAYLKNGTRPKTFDELDVEIPWPKTSSFLGYNWDDAKEGPDWVAEIEVRDNYTLLYMHRKTGRYKGAGFLIPFDLPQWQAVNGIPLCFERHSCTNNPYDDSSLAEGEYCQGIMQGEFAKLDQCSRAYYLAG